MNKFVIIAELRSGYQFLSQLLNSHSNIRCFGEIFGSDKSVRQQSFFRFQNKIPAIEENENIIYYIEKMNKKVAEDKNINSYGFKLNYVDCKQNNNWKNIWDYIKKNNWKIIHLKRLNLLDRLISYKLASKTGKWSWAKYDSKIDISFQELEFHYNQSKSWQQWTNDYFKNCSLIDINYEDLTNKTKETCERIQCFLNVKNEILTAELPKQRVGKQCYFISNYKKLYKDCQKNPVFKRYLTDVILL